MVLKAFFQWWARSLAELLPGQAAADGAPRHALLLDFAGPDGRSLGVTLRQRHGERAIGCYPMTDAGVAEMHVAMRGAGRLPAVALRLPAGTMLERQIALPLAAERDVAGALRYEMDRVTPFRPEDTFWSWDIAHRDRARGRLQLQLRLIPRAAVERALKVAAAAGIPVTLLEGRGADGHYHAIAITAPEWRPWQRHVLRAGTMACAGFAAAIVATPFIRQSLVRTDIEAQAAALQPRMREAQALRERLARDAASGDAVAATQAEFGDALKVLAAATDVLPDDTWLSDFVLKQRQITLRGQSANAARLIAVLSADAALRNPSFAAPVTRAAGGGPDLFTIAAEAAP